MVQRRGFAARYMSRGPATVISLLLAAFATGCAIGPASSQVDYANGALAERDLLSDAAAAVETAPWPKPQSISMFSRIAGAVKDDDADAPRISRSDAVEIYIADLAPSGAKFSTLANDATANLGAAKRLAAFADTALSSPRLTMNDVAAVEGAIQALRENRRIYVSAAKSLEKAGEPVDDDVLDALRNGYSLAIRDLGKAADALADRIEDDRSETFADDGAGAFLHENAAPQKPRYRRDLSSGV